MRLFIEPNDILMFRDGRPFSGGDDHFARGIFPPSPSTIYGAFRSHVLSIAWSEFNKFASNPDQIPSHIQKEIGTPEKIGSLMLRQVVLAEKDRTGVQQFFPMPKDIARQKGEDKKGLYLLKPRVFPEDRMMTDLPNGLFYPWSPTEAVLEPVSGFLSDREMSNYLIGNIPENWIDNDDLYRIEERTGILKNRVSRSVEQGGLYSVEYFRLKKDVGFAVEVANTELLPESGILRLGGDNRTAYYSKTLWNNIPIDPVKEKIAETHRFKIVLISPAIFKNGWLPGGIDHTTMEGSINGIAVKIIGASVGKPVGIGGFDLVKKMPKVMKKAVPAGSVYYFELKESNIDRVFEQIWLKSISDEKAMEGFGISLIGGY